MNRPEEARLLQLMTSYERARRGRDRVTKKTSPPKRQRFARQASRKCVVLETGRDHREASGQTGELYLKLKGGCDSISVRAFGASGG